VTYWNSGEQILWRYGDAVVHPMTVVEDGPEQLVAWLAMDTPILDFERVDGLEKRADKSTLFTAPRRQRETTWADYDVLRIYRPGQRWSTWFFFDGATASFEGYYCNIETVHVRDDHTTWSSDEVLDVWVEPDRTVGRKDEDELALAVAQSRYTQAEADDIIAVADAIEHEVAAWAPPFGAGWESFRPDPAWTSPTLDGVARLPGTFTSVRGEY
jgi:predicted RNA-binding protein associated with RNAse of E/G family